MTNVRDYDGIIPEAGEKLYVAENVFLDRILFYMREGKTPVFLCDGELTSLIENQSSELNVQFVGAWFPIDHKKWLFANRTSNRDVIDFTWMPDDRRGTIYRYFNRDYADNNWVFFIPVKEIITPMDIGSII